MKPLLSLIRWARSPTRTVHLSCSCCATTLLCGHQTCRCVECSLLASHIRRAHYSLHGTADKQHLHLFMCMLSLCRTKMLSSLVREVEMSRLRMQINPDRLMSVTTSCMNVRTLYAALLAHCDRWLPLPLWQIRPDMLWQLRNICTWAETAARLTFIVVSKMLHCQTVLCDSCCRAY